MKGAIKYIGYCVILKKSLTAEQAAKLVAAYREVALVAEICLLTPEDFPANLEIEHAQISE